MKTARIKVGNDNRRIENTGALLKWEDIVGVKSGTYVEIIKQCSEKKIATVSFPMGAQSPCGKQSFLPGTRRLVPVSALEELDLDTLAKNLTPWRTSK